MEVALLSAATSNVDTKTVNGTVVSTIRPNGCTPVSSFVYTYGSGTGNVSTNGINGDSLVSYNGKSITYDAVGNPVNYLGNTLTWDGRTLTKYVSADGSTTVTYTYDLDGVRTGKTVTEKVGTGASAYTKTTEYRYTYEGTTLLHETRLETYSQNKQDYDNISEITYDLYYTYSALGTLAQIEYTRTIVGWNGRTDSGTFLVTANSRGDIECLRYSDGTLYAEYEYDAWGNILDVTENDYFMRFSGSLCDVNPVRYRGYYFDEETGLYYCIGRYYDPDVGRFVNADVTAYLAVDGTFTSFNLFAYCGNNPVMGYDPEGTFDWNKLAKGLSIALVGITAIATVATAGCAAPVLAAAIAVTSGVTCVGFGAAEVVESFTGHNVIRDDIMGGNEELYNTVRTVVEVTATVSTVAVSVGAAANKAADPLSQCFIMGTLVLTSEGYVPIEEIKPGDLVMATDPETGETALKAVVQLFRNETTEWVHLTIDGEEITCTPEHPFYSPVKGWTAACDLRAGDILVTINGDYVVLEKIQHELLENPEVTYNFEVEDFHTYFVGDNGVLVHNACTPSNSKNYSPQKIADKYDISVEQYHKEVKPEILKEAPPKPNIVGRNPNIMLNKQGEIAYQGANGRGFQNTGLVIMDIIIKLGL